MTSDNSDGIYRGKDKVSSSSVVEEKNSESRKFLFLLITHLR